MRSAIVLATWLAACSGGGATDEPEAPEHPVPVTCAPARAGTTAASVDLHGVVSAPPDRQALVASGVVGRIVSVEVREGDRVRRGDLVARVEDPALPEAVAEAQAEVASARAGAEVARAALSRAERLLAEGITARREVEDARARSAAADAVLRSALAKQGLAAVLRDRARLVSPIEGTVVHVLRRAGELVDGTPATPVVEIADSSVLELQGDIPARDLVRVAEGGAATVTADALPGERFAARVAAVSPSVDPATSLGTVRITIVEADRMRIGMAGSARITVASPRTVVLVPGTAPRRSAEGRDEVVVCEAAGAVTHARIRAVELGDRQGEDVEVVSGIRAGERVVTSHSMGLEDDLLLAPTEGASR